MCEHTTNSFLGFSPTRHITPCCISILVHISGHKNWQRSAMHSQEKMKASILFLIIWLFIQGLTCTIWWVGMWHLGQLLPWQTMDQLFPSTSKNSDSLCPSLHHHEWLVILTGNIGVNSMENLSPLTDVPELPSILVVTVYVSQQQKFPTFNEVPLGPKSLNLSYFIHFWSSGRLFWRLR